MPVFACGVSSSERAEFYVNASLLHKQVIHRHNEEPQNEFWRNSSGSEMFSLEAWRPELTTQKPKKPDMVTPTL